MLINTYPYITKIKITGLFGEKDIEWKLDPRVNILGGGNGSGKSTILKCIFAILSNSNTNDITEGYSPLSLIKKATIGFSNNWEIIYDRQRDKNGGFLDLQPGSFSIAFALPMLDMIKEIGIIKMISEKGKCMSVDQILNVLHIDFLGSAEYNILSEETVKNISDKNKIRTNLDLLLFKEINKKNELLADSLFQKKSINPADFSDVLKSNNSLFNTINSFFKETKKELKSGTSSFDFVMSTGKIINCYSLSTGEKQLILSFLKVFNTNKQPCTLFLDEPDLGIHVDWQKQYIKALTTINPNCQFIITTHSPSMIGGWFDKVKDISQITVKSE